MWSENFFCWLKNIIITIVTKIRTWQNGKFVGKLGLGKLDWQNGVKWVKTHSTIPLIDYFKWTWVCSSIGNWRSCHAYSKKGDSNCVNRRNKQSRGLMSYTCRHNRQAPPPKKFRHLAIKMRIRFLIKNRFWRKTHSIICLNFWQS